MVTIETSKLFSRLGPAELSALRLIAREQKFAAGQDVFREGDKGDGVYLVKDGQVEISVQLAPGNRRVFAQVGPGEIFGEMAVLELKPRSATATASQNSIVYFIPRDELLAMVDRSATLSLELLREISRRLRDFDLRYVQEILQSERLAIIGRFARSIVHDLKNPLNIISLTAELTSMDQAPVEVRRKAGATIRQQVERVNDLVGEILEFTQGVPADRVLSAMDYGVFVQQVLDELRSEVELRSCRLESEGIPSVWLPIDPRRLRRVYQNLVHNAAEAMPAGGRVNVRFRVSQSEVVTEIEDSGPGIAPEMVGKLFEVFATHGKAHGTGLGLSIAKKIVEDHHGRIWAANQPGKGALFSFALPLAAKT